MDISTKNLKKILLTAIVLILSAMVSCTHRQAMSASGASGYNTADSIISDIGDNREFQRLITVTDSFERIGEIPKVRAIFYTTIAYNMMGQHRKALHLYYQLAAIPADSLNCQANIESYIYASKDYVRLLCDMRRYDRALREAQNADRKLKAAGYDTFVDHHDIAQMIGESQLYLDQEEEARKNFEKSLQGVYKRLSTNNGPLDLRECQKTMNAIARALMYRGHYEEAEPWIARQDSLLAVADSHPQRDSVYVDEMKADINYSKALLAIGQGRPEDAERAFAEYQSTQTAQQLGNIINSNEYLLQAQRYEEAANNYIQLDHFLKQGGYKADLENIGHYMIPKYKANLLAGHIDTAMLIATKVAEYYDTALIRQKVIDADLLATVYDTEGKERQIVEQRAELSRQRLLAVGVIMVLIIIFLLVYNLQRRKAFHELSETNRQLKLANQRAEESARMKTKFIQQISHEVRTPLNVLSGFSQVLATPDIDINSSELQNISHKIVENSERITKLVDKMLDLSMVNSDADIACNDTVTPLDIARQAIEASDIKHANHLQFQLQTSPQAESQTIVTNQKSAVKVLTLLLDNAIKFTHPLAYKGRKADSPSVTLSIGINDGKAFFVVEDTGIGIPSDQAENIFTEFVQLDEYSDGTGIGLSIARSLARHMHGDITLDTSYTSGARFVMTLG